MSQDIWRTQTMGENQEKDTYSEFDFCEPPGLDMSWIEESAIEDSKYTDFYEDDVTFVQLRILYINGANEICKIVTEKFHMLEPNKISKEELLQIIKERRTLANKHYNMVSVMKYNFDLSPHRIKPFIKMSPTIIGKEGGSPFLTSLNQIETVHFRRTITMFQDLNELFITYYDTKPESVTRPTRAATKRVRYTPNRNKTIKNNDLKIPQYI
jgi:hypothetical protein